MHLSRYLSRLGALAVLSAGLVAFAIACNKGDSSGKTNSTGGPGDSSREHSDQPLGGSKAEGRPVPAPQQPTVQPAVATNDRRDPSPAQADFASEQASAASANQSAEDQRAHAENLIYATIRVKMEEAIAERSKLLKAGTAPSDERIRSLEGTIMRARDLLTENGEVVEEVDPPIVQQVPSKE